jgi:hypothetical protein
MAYARLVPGDPFPCGIMSLAMVTPRFTTPNSSIGGASGSSPLRQRSRTEPYSDVMSLLKKVRISVQLAMGTASLRSQ